MSQLAQVPYGHTGKWNKTISRDKSHKTIQTCSLIVMPLSLSKSMLSRNCSFISRFCTVPVLWSSLSAKVDFPWSMCAMMQKFLMLDTGTCSFKPKTKRKVAEQILLYKEFGCWFVSNWPWEGDLGRLGQRGPGRRGLWTGKGLGTSSAEKERIW